MESIYPTSPLYPRQQGWFISDKSLYDCQRMVYSHTLRKNSKFIIVYERREAFIAWFEGGARSRICADGR